MAALVPSTAGVASGPRTDLARGPGLPPLVAVILSSWFMISPSLVPYPFTVGGENASLRDRGLSLLLLFAAVSWYRARTNRRVFLIAFAVLAALLVVEALTLGGGPGGSLGGASWNELIVGVLMLAAGAAGWRGSGTDRTDVT